MKTPCPDCGGDIDLAEQPVRLMRGTCAACGHPLSLLTNELLPPGAETSTGRGAPAEEGEEEGPSLTPALELPCSECGGALTLAAGPGSRLTATCAQCDSQFVYALQTEEAEAPEERRPMREPGRGRSFERAGPPARPCRQCGEPLTFSTNPDGTVTGSCASCGNTFTLPPRRTPSWEGGRGGGRFGGGRGFRGRPQGRGGWSPSPGRERRFGRRPREEGPPGARARPERRRRRSRDDEEE